MICKQKAEEPTDRLLHKLRSLLGDHYYWDAAVEKHVNYRHDAFI